MGMYWDSLKMLLVAFFALVLGFVWANSAFITFWVFLIFIIMAAQKAYAVSRTISAKIKLLSIFTAVLVILVVLGLTVLNPPQCPDSYTQEQINAAHGHCIIGANIGIGLYFIFLVMPMALVVTMLWVRTLLSARKPSK